MKFKSLKKSILEREKLESFYHSDKRILRYEFDSKFPDIFRCRYDLKEALYPIYRGATARFLLVSILPKPGRLTDIQSREVVFEMRAVRRSRILGNAQVPRVRSRAIGVFSYPSFSA
ncbi:hypothetical protein AYB33_01980 [Leptospira santarosai]|nr:hypothetical protein AYB33_01980 [Leptospira santarosai]